jgi:hypothetical protein
MFVTPGQPPRRHRPRPEDNRQQLGLDRRAVGVNAGTDDAHERLTRPRAKVDPRRVQAWMCNTAAVVFVGGSTPQRRRGREPRAARGFVDECERMRDIAPR